MGRTDEEREWAERVVGTTPDAFVDIAIHDPVLGAALLQVAEEELTRVVEAWGVVPPPGAVSIDVAPDTLRIRHGDSSSASRWDGTAEAAKGVVRHAIWGFADQWPAPTKGKRAGFEVVDGEEAWAEKVLDAVTGRLAADLANDDGPAGLQIALDLVRSVSRYAREANHAAVTSVIKQANQRQLFHALHSLAILACEAAPSREALDRLHDLGHQALS